MMSDLLKCVDLYAEQRRGESLLDVSRRVRADCPHAARDWRGQCFRCGDRDPAKADNPLGRVSVAQARHEDQVRAGEKR